MGILLSQAHPAAHWVCFTALALTPIGPDPDVARNLAVSGADERWLRKEQGPSSPRRKLALFRTLAPGPPSRSGGQDGVRYFFRGWILAHRAVVSAGFYSPMSANWFTTTLRCRIPGAGRDSAGGGPAETRGPCQERGGAVVWKRPGEEWMACLSGDRVLNSPVK